MAATMAAAMVSAASAATTPAEPPADSTAKAMVVVLNFDEWGDLARREDLALAKLRLAEFDPERIIIMAYGWGNDGRMSESTYYQFARGIQRKRPADVVAQRVAVIGIGWDSSQSAIGQLLDNVIPFPGVANGIAWLPDKLVFPISFWSKGAQADRIGYGGVRVALNDLFSIWKDSPRHPDVFLLGHSFGTRIVSGLMNDHMAGVRVGGVPFEAADHVRGAVLLQPALPLGSLDHGAHYPLMVTMSSYDHANGALYPLANVFLNTFAFTIFESVVQRVFLQPIQHGVQETIGIESDIEGEDTTILGQTVSAGRRTAGEFAALPLSLGLSLVILPIDYVYGQAQGIATRRLHHVMDTLAQIPGIQIGVAGLGRLLGREERWGQRSKGLFTIGPLHESVGRMVVTAMLGDSHHVPVMSRTEVESLQELPSDAFVVDASDIIRHGLFGLDLGNPLIGSTVGWIDLIGAHSDYGSQEVIDLMAMVVRDWLEKKAETVTLETAE